MYHDSFFMIIPFFIYLVPVIFVGWFLLRMLKFQKERNVILREISEKLDKRL